MKRTQEDLLEKTRNFFTLKVPLVVLAFATLGVIATLITNSTTVFRTVHDLLNPPIDTFSVPADQREDESVSDLSLVAPFPLGCDVKDGEDEDNVRQAGDEYMTFSVGALHGVDIYSLPTSWASQNKGPLVRNKEVDSLLPSGGHLTPATVKGFLFEYDASDGSDRTRLEVVARHNGKAVFARCAIEKRALEAYRSGCMELLDNVTLLPLAEHAPVLNFMAEVAGARFWQSKPVIFDETYDYLVANWSAYDPEVPHGFEPIGNEEKLLLSDEVVDQGPTMAGRPLYFSAVVDAAEKLSATEDGSTRWVIQMISNARPGSRFYVQVNAPAESTFFRGDVAMVFDAVLIAGGPAKLTDGNLDNTLYFLAQNIEVIPLTSSGT